MYAQNIAPPVLLPLLQKECDMRYQQDYVNLYDAYDTQHWFNDKWKTFWCLETLVDGLCFTARL